MGRLRRWGHDDPDRTACVVGDERVGYGDLLGAGDALAGLIGDDPPARGRTRPLVAVAAANSPGFVRAFAAADLAGAVVAVFDPSWSDVQFTAAAELLAPDLLVTPDPGLTARARALGLRTVHGDALAGHRPGPGLPAERDPGESFLIGFTSGTSSRPKAFVRSRRSWRDSLGHSAALFGAGPGSVTLAPGPLAHGLGLYALAESLHSGGVLVAARRFDVPAVADLARRHRATRFVGVPTMYQRILDDERAATALAGVRTFVSSGSKMSPARLRELFAIAPGSTFLEYYGASELSFVSVRRVTAADVHRDDGTDNGADGAGDRSNVGAPFPGVEVEIRGPDGTAVPDGTTGTVFVRSTLVSDGYLTPERTGFRRDGEWCTVGDIGFLAAGEVHVIGREGEMVIVGGNNVYPSEVEAALRSYPGVSDGYVLLADEPPRGETLVAALHASDAEGADGVDLPGLRAHLAARLPRYKIPRRVVLVRDWPMTGSGKVSKKELREAVETGADRVVRTTDWA